MNTLIVHEPMHERPLRRHHIRILLRLLGSHLLLGQLRSWVPWSFFAETGAMGRGVELAGLLEDEGFTGFLAGRLGRMADGQGRGAWR